MKQILFKDLHPHWHELSWVGSWWLVGKMRELCESTANKENVHWHFIDQDGIKTVGLPYGILFYKDTDALRFKLAL